MRSFTIVLGLTAACFALSPAAGCGDDTSGVTAATASSSSTGGPACTLDFGEDPVLPDPPLHTPRWAFEPWISKDISDGPDTYDFVGGFQDRKIPVGAVVLDSPWETNYNTLVPNPDRYPNFAQMVADMHQRGVRVVLWTTAFVNTSSFDLEVGGDVYPSAAPDHDPGVDCGYFVDGGQDYGWWKGLGASVDFFNPAARAWWHHAEDGLFSAGVDGFKLDFGDTYVYTDPVMTSQGAVPHQSYSEAYYQDFYAYGRKNRGDDFVTMVRAYDESYGYAGRFFARKENAPVAWMGDNRRDYVGLADALDETFRSAAAGYVVLGSDIGGYLDRDDVDLTQLIDFDPQVFARWTAVGALSPFMQLHGRANITPWTVKQTNDQITDLYRYWATLHHELVPFYYSLAEEAYSGNTSLVRPIGDQAAWPGDYRYQLGDAFLVAPLLDASGKRDVELPETSTYYDFWAPAADPLAGGQTLKSYDVGDLARVPLFVRSGAIVPLEVAEDLTGFGTDASAGKSTVIVYPDLVASSFVLHEADGTSVSIGAKGASKSFDVSFDRVARPTLLRVRFDGATAITVGGALQTKLGDRAAFDGAASGWFAEPATRSVWVHVPAGEVPETVHGS